MKVLRRYFPYILFGQPVCCALIQDGGKNHESAYDELIRDRLVVGLRDTRLAERLQLDPELTLEKAVIQARQSEAVKKQQVLLRDDQSSYGAKETVDAVHKSKLYRKKEQQKRKDQGHTAMPNPTCQRCGKSPSHARNSCPAKDAVCRKCTKKGHFAKVCKSRVK